MEINILVTGNVYSTQSGYSAIQFCVAALTAGHRISQVFFYEDAVHQASRLVVPLADEFDVVKSWQTLAAEHNISLLVCVSASERRGVLGDEQVFDHQLDQANLADGFTVAGLGALHDACLQSDRTVTFK